jgi:UDPglucose 6-dehydrogenase
MAELPIIGFAGMTHLGVVSSAAIAAQGFNTVCYDADADLAARLRAGDPPILEPDLQDLMRANGARQTFTNNLADLQSCDVVYISADVPTDDNAVSELGSIRALIGGVAKAMRSNAQMVVLCQVPPGFTRAVTAVPPERLFYQVETLVFGRAVERARHPERFIIGCAAAADPLPSSYRQLLTAFGCDIIPMRFESAELAKIAINCCLVASIGVANTLAEICEHIGADWSEIVPSLRLDKRIGPHAYLTPGLGIAGGNLERDLQTVIALAEQHRTDDGIVKAWITNSRHRRGWAVQELTRAFPDELDGSRIAVWGLAYKENTRSVKNSPSLATIAALPRIDFIAHDPAVPGDAVKYPNVTRAPTALKALDGARALLILTPWPEYRAIEVPEIVSRMKGRLVIDPYRVLNPAAVAKAGLHYKTLGLN